MTQESKNSVYSAHLYLLIRANYKQPLQVLASQSPEQEWHIVPYIAESKEKLRFLQPLLFWK